MIPKEYENKEEFLDAFEVAKQTSWNSEELKVYDYMALKEFDEINALRTAEEKGFNNGVKKGIEKQNIEVAKNLLKANIDIETICISTGLSKETIENLIT